MALASATFILEVSADMEADTLMKAFRAQSKFGPQDKIRQLVVQALRGIPIRARMNVPRQLPYHVNAVYFEIDTGHDLWKGIEQTGIPHSARRGDLPQSGNDSLGLEAIAACSKTTIRSHSVPIPAAR